MLIRDGRPVQRALRRAGISLAEPRSIARRQGYANLAEVHTAVLEANGVVSMFARDEPRAYHPTANALPPVPGQGESGAGE